MMNKKNHLVQFKVDEDMDSFLAEVSKKMKIDKSETCRRIVGWFSMAVILGEIKTTGLEKRFANYLDGLHKKKSIANDFRHKRK
jgi:hypothetical protein